MQPSTKERQLYPCGGSKYTKLWSSSQFFSHAILWATNHCQVIPSTDGQYIFMSFGVLVETITLDDGKMIKSMKTWGLLIHSKWWIRLSKSLLTFYQEIVLEYLLLSFLTYPQQNWSSSNKKGCYPYSYVSGREKFSEKPYRLLMNGGTL